MEVNRPKKWEFLYETIKEIEYYARGYGLDFFDVIFEIVSFEQMNMLAAYQGFPVRYPHWRFGMEYERLSQSYRYGLHKIYEMVINNDPCYAYLMEDNTIVDHKLVIAHVFAHCDFFKNNIWFEPTNRSMLDQMANHASRIRRFIDKYGMDEVEEFIDIALSIDNLIDYHSLYVKRASPDEEKQDSTKIIKFRIDKSYMRRHINPESFIEEQKRRIKEEEERRKKIIKFPHRPVRDVMKFLIENAPIRDWEADILSIIRDEAYYFAPQAMTKIMNEGWATYWHSKIMTEKVLKDSEIIDYADHHSGTIAQQPGTLNPYRLGVLLYKEIEEVWNKGKFGKDYEECDNLVEKEKWDLHLGLGMEKIFEVRKIYNDISFIDEFLTEEFASKHRLFTYDYNKNTGNWEISSRDFNKIKQKLLMSLTNLGNPIIDVVDANYKNRGELLLRHLFEGIPLDEKYTRETLPNIYRLWKRPVHIVTCDENGSGILYSFDGSDSKKSSVRYDDFKY